MLLCIDIVEDEVVLKDSTQMTDEVVEQVGEEIKGGTEFRVVKVERQGVERRINRYKKHKKTCWLCRQGKLLIDYKEVEFLKNYLKRYNKILIHKFSGNCLKHQHQLSQAIKRARYIALLPFVAE